MKDFEDLLKEYHAAVSVNDSDTLSALLKHARDAKGAKPQALALLIEAVLLRSDAQLGKAYATVKEAYALADETEHERLQYDVRAQLAGILFNQAEYPAAMELYRRQLDDAENGNDELRVAVGLNNVAMIYLSTGQMTKAVEYFEKARVTFIAADRTSFAGNATLNLAICYNTLTEPKKVVEYAARARELYESANNQSGVCSCISIMGMGYHDAGEPERGLPLLEEAREMAQRLKNKDQELQATTSLIRSLIGLDRLDEAQALIDGYAALDFSDRLSIVQFKRYQAQVWQKQGRLDEAKTLFTEVLEIAKELDRPTMMESTHIHLQEIAKEQGDFESYIHHSAEVQRIKEQVRGAETVRSLAIQEKDREIERERAERERERAILYSTLPDHVADRLVRGEGRERGYP